MIASSWWNPSRLPVRLAFAMGCDVHIALVAVPPGLVTTPSDLQEFVWGVMDAHIIPGKWPLTPFCLPQDLCIERRRFISIFGSASYLAGAFPLPRSKNYFNALPGQLIVERNISRIPRWPLWIV